MGRSRAAKLTEGDKVLFPRSAIGGDAFVAALGDADVTGLPVYDTVAAALPSPLLDMLKEGRYDDAVFASASAVRSFAASGAQTRGKRAVCIGEKTAEEARDKGFEVYVSDEMTMDSVADRLVELVTSISSASVIGSSKAVSRFGAPEKESHVD
jgi:uroporphyrinogen III methyltransferase/synthase